MVHLPPDTSSRPDVEETVLLKGTSYQSIKVHHEEDDKTSSVDVDLAAVSTSSFYKKLGLAVVSVVLVLAVSSSGTTFFDRSNTAKEFDATMLRKSVYKGSSKDEIPLVNDVTWTDPSEPSAQFGVLKFSKEHSLLKQMYWASTSFQSSPSIRYPLCIHHVDLPTDVALEEKVRFGVEKAMNTWIHAMADQPSWFITDATAYRVDSGDYKEKCAHWASVGECDKNPGYMLTNCKTSCNVPSSSCPEMHDGLRVYEIQILADLEGANAAFWDFRMNIGRGGSDWVVGHPQFDDIILHEVGHQIGLSDTYTIPGTWEPIDQPDGVMNDLYSVNGVLQKDDIDGIHYVWAYIWGWVEQDSCPQGYKKGGLSSDNTFQAFLCVPE